MGAAEAGRPRRPPPDRTRVVGAVFRLALRSFAINVGRERERRATRTARMRRVPSGWVVYEKFGRLRLYIAEVASRPGAAISRTMRPS